MSLGLPVRKRRRTAVTVARPSTAKQVLDRKLWQEGRAKIAKTALPLFARHGYHATPVRAIADAAGLSVGSIFNYYPEKDDILREILEGSQAETEQAVTKARQQLEAADTNANPVDLFSGVYRSFVASIDAVRRFTLLAYQETKTLTPEKRTLLLDRDRRIVELLKQAAEPAISAGIFSAAGLDLKLQCLVSLAHAWALRRWALPQYATVDQYVADLEAVAVAIMAAQPNGD